MNIGINGTNNINQTNTVDENKPSSGISISKKNLVSAKDLQAGKTLSVKTFGNRGISVKTPNVSANPDNANV